MTKVAEWVGDHHFAMALINLVQHFALGRAQKPDLVTNRIYQDNRLIGSRIYYAKIYPRRVGPGGGVASGEWWGWGATCHRCL